MVYDQEGSWLADLYDADYEEIRTPCGDVDFYVEEARGADGPVVEFGCGTGNPYFTTDTAAALRAAEIHADVILKATRVDGVYNADPEVDSNATRYDRLTFEEAIQKNLQFMDQTAIQLCRENGCPIVVFDMSAPGNIQKVVVGETVGTTVSD